MTARAAKRDHPANAKRTRLAPTARRALIDEAATRVFAECGYEAATMQDIAAAAGVVASVLYDHYPSKKKLYVELLEQHGRTLIERTIRVPAKPDGRGELRSQIDDFFSTIEADPFVWRMLFRDPGDPEVAAVHTRVHEQAGAAIGAVLSGENEPSVDGPDPVVSMIAQMVRSSLDGLASWWWEHREIRREDVIDTATMVIWDGLASLSASRSKKQNQDR